MTSAVRQIAKEEAWADGCSTGLVLCRPNENMTFNIIINILVTIIPRTNNIPLKEP